MATLIKINGKKENIESANGKAFTLEELQKAVNGYIQLIPINSGKYAGKLMIIDEEGLLKSNPKLNEVASEIADRRIVGQVLIIDKTQIK
ncbi:MAG: hypothetical protein JEZ01_20965 [Labilibaculum sp.]|nr:hypothetical protein [Labilibaculum sp.]MBI9060251.1 hypothetical protein [Labilibaculum sp.]